MENQQLNLLDRVYTVLRKRGEETEWITSADNHEIRTGIAFVPCDTFTPVSLLYTMMEHPETLVIDVLFAAKVPESRRVEVSIILSELNADQTRRRLPAGTPTADTFITASPLCWREWTSAKPSSPS